MDTKTFGDYQVEDFVADESFANYHFCLNAADQVFWERWILNHSDRAAMAEEAKNILDMLSLTLSRSEYKEELKHLKEAMTIESVPAKTRKMPLFRFLNWNEPHTGTIAKVRIAVVALIPILLLLFIGKYFISERTHIDVIPLTTKFNSDNKPVVFTLEDGTVITLAANSSLKYPLKFEEKERKVYLQGEAQFEVAHDKDHPFKVYQDNIIATVLGTIFNIKKQSNDSVISIELLKGKLLVEAVSAPGSLPQSIILEPNQRAIYALHDQSLIKETWKQNRDENLVSDQLVFKQSGFEEISVRIKDLYGVTVINQSNKKNWRFTGEFKNATAKEIMENICLIKKLNLEIKGDTLLIKNAAVSK